MRTAIRWMSRKALWVVTAVSPVVIAACYGMEYMFSRHGVVVDRSTGAGIAGIKVTCRSSTYGDTVDYSTNSGQFWLENDDACSAVAFEDVDGALNGSYQSRTVAVSEVEDDGIVELDPTATR
jgi:GMP synthase-like glutamine amidotransferase